MSIESSLPPFRHVLAVCAHPDDESFGLGAILSGFAEAGAQLDVLCFTAGEASTLGAGPTDLASVRRAELTEASVALGIRTTTLLLYPDGGLASVPVAELTGQVMERDHGADALLVFDEGGITGHPDHCQATRSAVDAAEHLNLPVLAWAIPDDVADDLNRTYGTTFVGRRRAEIDVEIRVKRARQIEAIRKHHSQSCDNPVLWRRLELQGDREWLRFLRHPSQKHQESAAGRRGELHSYEPAHQHAAHPPNDTSAHPVAHESGTRLRVSRPRQST